LAAVVAIGAAVAPPAQLGAQLGAQQRADWPAARFNHAMCFDGRTRATLMFGGRPGGGGSESDAALWAWDGERWAALARTGPSARSSPVLVCDSRSGRAVLYGGYSRSVFGDTWEWDGKAWTQRDSAGMSPRGHAAAALDPTRGTVILFGGFVAGGSAPLGETWEWDGRSWTRLDVAGPPARYAHAMMTDPRSGRIVLHGGIAGFGAAYRMLSDTWEWDGRRWRQLADDGPTVPADRSLTADVAGAAPLLIGARETGDASMSVWALSDGRWRPAGMNGAPSARVGQAAALDTIRGVVVMFGGQRDGRSPALAELWELSADAWHGRGAGTRREQP
jgi:hypothetical protein